MSSLVDSYTSFFSLLGLHNEITRFLFGTAIGFAGQLLIKPGISYHKNGTPKAFISETYLPWYILSAIPGLIFSLFF
jgi:hypothetical protein